MVITDFSDAENEFYLESHPNRLAKFLSHAKLYEMSLGLPGDFLEAGVFKGASFCRFRKLGRLFHPDHTRNFIGFDVFGKFPDADYEPDEDELIRQNVYSGEYSIEIEKFYLILKSQGLCDNVELIKGDIRSTIPEYMNKNPQLSLSIVNLDLDLYEPLAVSIRCIFPRLVQGGILILDDYEGFPGAKKAVDEYFEELKIKIKIRKFSFAMSPCYVVKE